MKKYLLFPILSAFSLNSYAIDLNSVVTQDEIVGSSQALVEKIKEDPDHFHWVNYDKLALKEGSVKNVTGEVVLDEQNHLKTIHISTVSFTALNVPLFGEYSATVDLQAHVTLDCKLESEGRVYKITASSNPLVYNMFVKDLTGNGFTKEAYADVVFNYLLTHSTKLRSYCNSTL